MYFLKDGDYYTLYEDTNPRIACSPSMHVFLVFPMTYNTLVTISEHECYGTHIHAIAKVLSGSTHKHCSCLEKDFGAFVQNFSAPLLASYTSSNNKWIGSRCVIPPEIERTSKSAHSKNQLQCTFLVSTVIPPRSFGSLRKKHTPAGVSLTAEYTTITTTDCFVMQDKIYESSLRSPERRNRFLNFKIYCIFHHCPYHSIHHSKDIDSNKILLQL